MKVKIGVLAVLLASFVMAAPTITAVTAQQRYPWNGMVDIAVTFAGASNEVERANCTFAATNSAMQAALATSQITEIGVMSGSGMTWTRHFVWDATADVGEVKIADVALFVEATAPLGGVQLWENGPWWAECNVGASQPEEYGYYFWWGDTVGYTREDGTWVSSTGVRMASTSSPFTSSACPTYNKNCSQLQSAGYIDSTGNLVAAYDAATVHLGMPWRMPMKSEIYELICNCDTTWTTHNGVYGRLVTGKGAYASKSIFLPAAGTGDGSSLRSPSLRGNYWSSTPSSDSSNYVWRIRFESGYFSWDNFICTLGQSVRPVRGFVEGRGIGVKMTCLTLDIRAMRDAFEYTPFGSETNYAVSCDWLIESGIAKPGDSAAVLITKLSAPYANGYTGWEAYVAGLTATNQVFRAEISFNADRYPVLGWSPNLNGETDKRLYRVFGRAKLGEGDWESPLRGNHQFFKVEVTMPDGVTESDKPILIPKSEPKLSGVQLWENGPYWAECNVGATKPEEYGYYFWWGDTEGYTPEGETRTDNRLYSDVTWISSMGTRMSSSPFYSLTCPTYGKDGSQLQSAGYIDSTGNLVAAHDAATVHLGAPWRMPTRAEFSVLVSKCDTIWTMRNGVNGRLVIGKGAYASKSIFLPAAGCGYGFCLNDSGLGGFYYSSTPNPYSSDYEWGVGFSSGSWGLSNDHRSLGLSVRPVREFAK